MNTQNIKVLPENKMTHLKFCQELLKSYPLFLQCSWDQSACYLSNDPEQRIKRVFLGLDLNWEWLKNQYLNQNDLILVHHPIFLCKFQKFQEKEILHNIYSSGATLICLHTNYDQHPDGMNTKLNWLFPEMSYIVNEKGICFITLKNKCAFNDIRLKLISNLASPCLISGDYDLNKSIKKIAILLGSGGQSIKEIFNLGDIDLFLTGDLKWHDWILASSLKLCVIDLHHQTESIFIAHFQQWINKLIKKKNNDDILVISIPLPIKLQYFLNKRLH